MKREGARGCGLLHLTFAGLLLLLLTRLVCCRCRHNWQGEGCREISNNCGCKGVQGS